ncbi:MFS transporter [Kineosporia sp. J2-2]|uniref:MFS transporter n=1 Tax=Kineosporia corallincola TaxID=2835133 RepID=A0ABS5TQ08_9ACTN|nr:MFS transporter [Kineosporia corallincola]MBT0773191.1 MFS transporter [Kineosporia corallincola]
MSSPASVPELSPENPENPVVQEIPDDVAPDTGQVPSRATIARFGAGYLFFGICWAIGLAMVANVLLPQRLTDIGVSSPDAWFGTINSVTAIVSLVANLVFGNLSDRSRSRFGRRSPWLLFGGIIAAVSIFLVGVVGSPVAIMVIYCVTMVGLNMMLAPALAVIADRVPLNVRGTMSAFFGGGATIGYPLGALIGAAFITATTPGYVLAAVLLGLSGVLTLFVWPRERSAERQAAVAGGFRDLLASFRPPAPRSAPDFYKAFVGRLFMLISYQMIAAYQLYIVQNYVGQSTVKSAATISTMSIITLVVGLVASLGSGPITDRIGRRKAPAVVAAGLFAVGVAMPWIFPSSMGMFLYAAIAGFGYGVFGSVDQAINVDVLPSKEEAGKDLGILNLATTLGQTIGPIITSTVAVSTGAYGLIFPISIAMAVIGALSITRITSVR